MATQVISTVALSIIALAGSTAHAQMTEETRNTILEQHNAARRTIPAANMLELVYDPKLECVARGYIEKSPNGEFKNHNPHASEDYKECGGDPSDGVGANWWSGQPDQAIWGWTECKWPYGDPNGCSERERWIANTNNLDPKAALNEAQLHYAMTHCKEASNYEAWGHFSQVMWATTSRVGCWWTEKYGTLCNYAPAGNMIDWYTGKMSPYVIYGEACSKCPKSDSSCFEGLCTSCE